MKIKFNKEVEDQIEIIKELKNLTGQTTSLVENLRIDHVRDRIFDLQQDSEFDQSWSKINVKIYDLSMTALWDSMEKQNLKLLDIQEREKFHTKLIINTFNKILTWNFLKLEKEIAI